MMTIDELEKVALRDDSKEAWKDLSQAYLRFIAFQNKDLCEQHKEIVLLIDRINTIEDQVGIRLATKH